MNFKWLSVLLFSSLLSLGSVAGKITPILFPPLSPPPDNKLPSPVFVLKGIAK